MLFTQWNILFPNPLGMLRMLCVVDRRGSILGLVQSVVDNLKWVIWVRYQNKSNLVYGWPGSYLIYIWCIPLVPFCGYRWLYDTLYDYCNSYNVFYCPCKYKSLLNIELGYQSWAHYIVLLIYGYFWLAVTLLDYVQYAFKNMTLDGYGQYFSLAFQTYDLGWNYLMLYWIPL